jgi:NADH-quinone oxidoreductase subunit N
MLAAVGSIVYGALGALVQTKVKRLIGYTSINQMGFLLLGVGCGTLDGLAASFFYLFFYIIMSFCFFSVILYIQDIKTKKELLYINQLNFLGANHRFLAIFLALLLFSMAGIPPLAGFFGKFFLFLAVFQTGNFIVSIFVLITNVISVFYYLRLIKCMFFEADKYQHINQSNYFCFLIEAESFNSYYKLSLWANTFILVFTPFLIDQFYGLAQIISEHCVAIKFI